MQRNWILPALLIACVAALMATAARPYLPGAQEQRGDNRRAEVQAIDPNSLPALVPPPVADVKKADPVVRGDVQPAAFKDPAPAAPVLAAGGNGAATPAPAANFGVTALVDGSGGAAVVWPLNNDTPMPIKTRTVTSLTLKGVGGNSKKLKLTVNDNVQLPVTVLGPDPWSVAIDLSGPSRLYTISYELNDPATDKAIPGTKGFFKVFPAEQNSTPPTLTVSPTKYYDSFSTPGNPVNMSGRFLSLKVAGAADSARIEPVFFLKVGQTEPRAIYSAPTMTERAKTSEGRRIDLQIPGEFKFDSTGVLAVRFTGATGTESSTYAADVAISVAAPGDVAKPTVGPEDVNTTGNPPAKVLLFDPFNAYVTKFSSVTIKANVTPQVADAKVLIYRGSSTISEAESVALTGGSATFTVKDLKEGENVFSFAVAKGDKLGEFSDPVRILVRTTPPKATDVGAFPADKIIRIQFHSANPIKDPSSVAFIIAYTSKSAPNTVAFTYKKLDQRTNTVELETTGDITPGTYKITIPNTIADVFGNPGEEQKLDLVVPVGAEGPLVAPGISARTGEYVPFPEFTVPRTNSQGFNPGDKVDSRVVRLYYFRDAHRVAQIINRDLKSYNRAAVDTKRRLAELARDDAVNQSLKRKTFERDAVQVAQETRAKEHELKAAQDFLQDAVNRRAKFEQEVPQATQIRDDVVRKGSLDPDRSAAFAKVTTAEDAFVKAQAAQVEKTRLLPTGEEKRQAAEKFKLAQDNLAAAKGVKDDQQRQDEAKAKADAKYQKALDYYNAVKEQDLAAVPLQKARQDQRDVDDKIAAADRAVAAAKVALESSPNDEALKTRNREAVKDRDALIKQKQDVVDPKVKMELDSYKGSDYFRSVEKPALDRVLDAQREQRNLLLSTPTTPERNAADTALNTANGALGTARDKLGEQKTSEDQKLAADDAVNTKQRELAAARQTLADLTNKGDSKANADFNVKTTQDALDRANADIEKARSRVISSQGALQAAQNAEVQKRETWQQNLELEDKMKADQFRLEVAAMHTDPDSYVAGKPNSNDPVQQVSISVIGASEIHLRGPISGINIIREMINQIDSPTGQVRVSVHTVQINGERQDKMEKVARDIQEYIDHSRFLTQQSSLMLRKAVLKVASRKAYMANQRHAHDTQADRDIRYLYEFFGRDFIEELRVQKSEFLNTGNKLLSLNSMDTTSLASTLFVIALAKNDTRREIIEEFKAMLAVQLPMAEQTFYEAAGPKLKSGPFAACFPRKHCMELMAQNAKFQSFIGFFDADVLGDDTLTPVQREFIKLAQILKSRLITELEFKQRVMERTLVEDRAGGDYLAELKEAARNEKAAKDALAMSREQLRNQRNTVLQTAVEIRAFFDLIRSDLQDAVDETEDDAVPASLRKTPLLLTKKTTARLRDSMMTKEKSWDDVVSLKLKRLDNRVTVKVTYSIRNDELMMTFTDPDTSKLGLVREWAEDLVAQLKYYQSLLDQFKFDTLGDERTRYVRAKNALQAFESQVKAQGPLSVNVSNLKRITPYQNASMADVEKIASGFSQLLDDVVKHISRDPAQIQMAYSRWVNVKEVKQYILDPDLLKRINAAEGKMDKGFIDLLKSDGEYKVYAERAERSRRPLDHKKMLDMLIDEIQEKYVDLLEGTRSYTANIDDYIKRVATALDDDFNTQFYYPAFRQVRNTAASWDVNLGQIETTSILTNNRTYAKVDPQATMEFDLPRRKILITEAFQGAKGLLDTYGALMQDPTFLNLVRMSGGMPTSMPSLGQNAGVPAIRSVLPGLAGVSDESFLAQGGPIAKSFGTPLDALVPDPAIYKFETGTAYEIRPIIQPDGQSVSFRFNYMYSTSVREPVRADEKHLGRIKRHFIDTDVQLGNYELREISRYQVALRASRTAKGVPLLQDIPGVGVLFRPLPSAETSLQQNVILGQSTIFPTLFDLMGLRWAPSVADLDPLALTNADFIVRQRKQFLYNRVFDYASARVDEALQIPDGERRGDLYRSQHIIPYVHPNGYQGPGMNLRDSHLRETYNPKDVYPESKYAPGTSREGHVNPDADAQYNLQRKMMQPGGPVFVPPVPTPIPGGKKPVGSINPMPIPGGGLPGLTLPVGPMVPQSMMSPEPASIFTTVRLSSANLDYPDTGVSPARLAGYAAPPAQRRTLWGMMFGNR